MRRMKQKVLGEGNAAPRQERSAAEMLQEMREVRMQRAMDEEEALYRLDMRRQEVAEKEFREKELGGFCAREHGGVCAFPRRFVLESVSSSESGSGSEMVGVDGKEEVETSSEDDGTSDMRVCDMAEARYTVEVVDDSSGDDEWWEAMEDEDLRDARIDSDEESEAESGEGSSEAVEDFH